METSVHGLENQLEILARLAYPGKIADPASLIGRDKQQYIIIWCCQCCDVLMQNKQQIDTKIITLVCCKNCHQFQNIDDLAVH